MLSDIRDSRLIRFDLPRNHSLYFANAVVSAATDAPYFLVQDSDDWSLPQRVELLLKAIESEKSDFAVSSEVQFREDPGGRQEVISIRYQHRADSLLNDSSKNPGMETFSTHLDGNYRFRVTHHALIRISSLRAIGGYFAGFRQHFDTLITNLLLMTGRLSHVAEPLYWRLHWSGALTKKPDTGFGSHISNSALKNGERIYRQVYEQYQNYIRGVITASALAGFIRNICRSNITNSDRLDLINETNRLRTILSDRQNLKRQQVYENSHLAR
jgi:hypothetical protein